MRAFTAYDLRTAMATLHVLSEASASAQSFARRGIEVLGSIVPADLTNLSACDFDTTHRSVVPGST